MASKLTPFLMRTAVRSAGRAARPWMPQARTLSATASRASDSLMVVSGMEQRLLALAAIGGRGGR
jgi:NADH dehydrogenase (ubiquinone) flavoprotein 2